MGCLKKPESNEYIVLSDNARRMLYTQLPRAHVCGFLQFLTTYPVVMSGISLSTSVQHGFLCTEDCSQHHIKYCTMNI